MLSLEQILSHETQDSYRDLNTLTIAGLHPQRPPHFL